MFQIEVTTCGLDYYISQVTYPSAAYYELTVSATVGTSGVLFVPQPANQGADAIVYCNIKGRSDAECEAVFHITAGSTCETFSLTLFVIVYREIELQMMTLKLPCLYLFGEAGFPLAVMVKHTRLVPFTFSCSSVSSLIQFCHCNTAMYMYCRQTRTGARRIRVKTAARASISATPATGVTAPTASRVTTVRQVRARV